MIGGRQSRRLIITRGFWMDYMKGYEKIFDLRDQV
jgi:hypothetical protein